jgi:CRP-like cAMP-binding protein
MTVPQVSLLEAAPALARLMSPEELPSAAAIRVPVLRVSQGDVPFMDRLEAGQAFGALLLEGVLVHEVSLWGRSGLRLLGPGDIVARDQDLGPMLLERSRWQPAGEVKVAVLAESMLRALARWPALMAGLYAREAQQVGRLAAQLLICQLPRVEDRVLALLWLLAESWGRVTPSGTRVPIDLTHETLGMMVGARRPTVSLALRQLADQGAVVRQPGGWLLLKSAPGGIGNPVEPDTSPTEARPQVLAADGLAGWKAEPDTSTWARTDTVSAYESLREAIDSLRAQHLHNVARFEQRLGVLQSTRQRCRDTRRRVASERRTRARRPPS